MTFLFFVLALFATGLALALFLFVSVKKDVQACRHAMGEARQQSAKADEEFGKLKAEVSRLDTPVAGTSLSSINVNKRAQAMRMIRQGESPGQIASALVIPLQEARLLAKIAALQG